MKNHQFYPHHSSFISAHSTPLRAALLICNFPLLIKCRFIFLLLKHPITKPPNHQITKSSAVTFFYLETKNQHTSTLKIQHIKLQLHIPINHIPRPIVQQIAAWRGGDFSQIRQCFFYKMECCFVGFFNTSQINYGLGAF
jgi:hypothetical protein